MKFLSLLCLIGVINAIYWGLKNQWMFDPTREGGYWWVADVAVGVICLILGPTLWRIAEARSHRNLYEVEQAHRQGRISEEEREAAWRTHERDFR